MIRWQPKMPQGYTYKVDRTRLYSAMHEGPAPEIFLEELVTRTVVVNRDRRN